MVFAVVKKGLRRETPPETKRSEKNAGDKKTRQLKKCRMRRLRGDSPSGLAANAPIRSALS